MVVVRESKVVFNDQMSSLLQILLIASIVGLAIIYLLSQYLGFIAYQPITHFISQIKNRNGINFKEPIVLEHSYTEIKNYRRLITVSLIKFHKHFRYKRIS